MQAETVATGRRSTCGSPSLLRVITAEDLTAEDARLPAMVVVIQPRPVTVVGADPHTAVAAEVVDRTAAEVADRTAAAVAVGITGGDIEIAPGLFPA